MGGNHRHVALYRRAQPGEFVTFGRYPQTAGGADETPITWRVLQNSGTELFILSERILDCKRYHAEYVDITWRDSDLRKWLNETFYEATFSAAEKEWVRMALCTDNGDGSPDTRDRVFLPSIAEIKSLTETVGKDFRCAISSEFAKVKKADGCHLYVYDKRVGENYRVVSGEKQGCSWWWLRTQPGSPDRAAFIGTQSSIRSYCRVNRTSYGVRPALKLNLR